MLKQHAFNAHLPSVRRVNDEGTNLDSPLLLVDDVNDACRLPIAAFGNEHVLPRRKLTNTVNATRDVRVKDASRMCTVVSIVKRSQCSDHEVGDPLEVVCVCFAYDDVAD